MIVLSAIVLAPSSRAQEGMVVLLDTNLPGAVVYADTLRLGTAARGAFVVPAATRELRLVPPGGDAWAIEPVSAPLQASPGDTLALDMTFPYHYKVESIPFGASVFLKTMDGRTRLGETPILHEAPEPLDGLLVVEEPGYATAEVEPGKDVWNRYVLTLQPVTPATAENAEMDWRPPSRPKRWIDYTAAAVALGAGVLAVHYKFKADRMDDRYRETGDTALRDRIQTFDTRSAVALGVMQVGVGVLALRFILR